MNRIMVKLRKFYICKCIRIDLLKIPLFFIYTPTILMETLWVDGLKDFMEQVLTALISTLFIIPFSLYDVFKNIFLYLKPKSKIKFIKKLNSFIRKRIRTSAKEIALERIYRLYRIYF